MNGAENKAVFLSYASPAFAVRRRCAMARQEPVARQARRGGIL
jgi:hypothetical protein